MFWWDEERLGIRIVYAITSEAISYYEVIPHPNRFFHASILLPVLCYYGKYQQLVRNYGSQVLHRYGEPSSHFKYEASVHFHDTFECPDGNIYNLVHAVTMKLNFKQSFAATVTEGMFFEKKRVVVLNAASNVVYVSGDGATDVPIFAT